MTDAYDLRSNIKGKPGSQGTLFQVKDRGLLNPEQRWPQGYTPERLNTVRDALKDTRFKTYAGDSQAPQHKWEHLDREHFAKVVARTTVPPEDLHGISEVNHQHGKDNYAEYRPLHQDIGWNLSKPEPEANLIHEIGHHVDNVRSRSAETMEGTTQNLIPKVATKHAEADWEMRGKHGAPNSTALSNAVARVRVGIGEAFADNYYTQHYRGPGRKGQQPTTGRYEDIQGEEGLKMFPGYRDVRPAPHMGPQFHDDRLF